MSVCNWAVRQVEQYGPGTGWRWLFWPCGRTLADGARISCGGFRASGCLASVSGSLIRDARVLVLRGEGCCR